MAPPRPSSAAVEETLRPAPPRCRLLTVGEARRFRRAPHLAARSGGATPCVPPLGSRGGDAHGQPSYVRPGLSGFRPRSAGVGVEATEGDRAPALGRATEWTWTRRSDVDRMRAARLPRPEPPSPRHRSGARMPTAARPNGPSLPAVRVDRAGASTETPKETAPRRPRRFVRRRGRGGRAVEAELGSGAPSLTSTHPLEDPWQLIAPPASPDSPDGAGKPHLNQAPGRCSVSRRGGRPDDEMDAVFPGWSTGLPSRCRNRTAPRDLDPGRERLRGRSSRASRPASMARSAARRHGRSREERSASRATRELRLRDRRRVDPGSWGTTPRPGPRSCRRTWERGSDRRRRRGRPPRGHHQHRRRSRKARACGRPRTSSSITRSSSCFFVAPSRRVEESRSMPSRCRRWNGPSFTVKNHVGSFVLRAQSSRARERALHLRLAGVAGPAHRHHLVRAVEEAFGSFFIFALSSATTLGAEFFLSSPGSRRRTLRSRRLRRTCASG